MKNPVLVLALMAPNALFAQETRDLGAHEHGHSSLNIAIEGTQIAMELEAPGADIVGFEHEAKTAEDRAKLDAAIAGLSKPLSLFVLPSAAGCTVTSSSAGLIDEHHEEGDGHGEHEEHAEGEAHDEHAEGEGHGEHEEHAEGEGHDEHEEHAEGEGHDDHDHAAEDGAEHTEFHANYLLTCSDPAAIDSVEFAFFTTFPNAEEVEVTMISDKGPQLFEVGRDEPVLDLSGLI